MIYFDNAATTVVIERCLDIYVQYQLSEYFNPSAVYHPSFEISKKIKNARGNILNMLNGKGEIIFTSSGSESDNMALFCTSKKKNGKIVVSALEHPAVMNSALKLKQLGYQLEICPVDNSGRVLENEFYKIVDEGTTFISVMHVNNVTGCINDIKKLCQIAKTKNSKVIFHSDGVQSVGKIKVDLDDLGVDLYSFSGHKVHCVKGVAGLFIKSGVFLQPLIYGGGQEFGIRASTENVGGILSLEQAMVEATSSLEIKRREIEILRNDLKHFFIQNKCFVVESIDQSPYILCVAMPKVRGEVLLHSLEKYEIYIGTGSACSNNKPTRVLPKILQLKSDFEKGIIRISFSRFTTKDEIEIFKQYFQKEFSELYQYVK